jgi:hypothetical protein
MDVLLFKDLHDVGEALLIGAIEETKVLVTVGDS